MKQKNVTRLGLGVATAVATALYGMHAWGQESAASPQSEESTAVEGLNEIVVTATRRSERLQDVPTSITAFTSEAIERSNVTRPIDFINATPNLSAVEANNAGDLRITIRGDAQRSTPMRRSPSS